MPEERKCIVRIPDGQGNEKEVKKRLEAILEWKKHTI